MTTTAPVCSRCHSTQLRAVSVIVGGELVGSVNQWGELPGQVRLRSAMARQLAAPKKPYDNISGLVGVVAALGALGAWLGVEGVWELAAVPLALAAAFGIGLAASYPRLKAEQEKKTQAWEAQMTVWHRLQHCDACAQLQDPVTKATLAPKSAWELAQMLAKIA